ncbi:MAG: aldehyde ferredoxin oxidoreductase family protein [Bacteroidia bacterium]|nr:aldehyde ferredoxin oxidoreductase family protein [Bacteroidia bacterium]
MSYSGKHLVIDLTKGNFEVQHSDKELLEKFIGAKGLGFAILDKLAPNPEPLGAENPLIFINGPFTGTKVQTSARTTLVTKSPLTNSMNDSHCGGNFGPRLKATGYDYIIIIGRSSKPVYIYVSEKKVEIKEATDLWGKGIFETNDILIKRHPGTNPRVAAIGPAGENLSKIACISVDKHRNFGRGGVGAVMGSKNLKAIICDGNSPIKYYNEENFRRINTLYTKEILDLPSIKFRRQKGTMKCIRGCQENEILPVKNFQQVTTKHFESLSSETARATLNWEDTACFGCAIQCSKWARWDGHEIEGPEYETTAFIGAICEIYNIKDVALANEMCNDLGMDTISAGSITGFAMECYEKGLIDDWDGLKMTWGNAEAQRELLKKMAYRQGIGDLFTEGTRIAAEKIGKGSSDFAINIHGMELSGINPKGSLTMGVAMAVADFASHTRLWIAEQEIGPNFRIQDIPSTVAEGIDTVNIRNSLVVCDFVPLNLDKLAELLNTITGFSYSGKDLLNIGTRITHLARRYNLRNGRTYKDDTLPARFFDEVSLSGFMKDKKIDRNFFNGLIQEYYNLRKWNNSGVPTGQVLAEFGL